MKNERGMTLIELLVASLIMIVVLGIVGGMLISSMTGREAVTDTSASSNEGQLVARSISRAAFHAAKIDVHAPAPDIHVLRMLVIDDSLANPTAAHCEAWYFGNGEMRVRRSPSAIPLPVGITDVDDWTLLAGGVEAVGSTPVFAVSGRTVDLAINVNAGQGMSALITTTASSRQPDVVPSDVETLCF